MKGFENEPEVMKLEVPGAAGTVPFPAAKKPRNLHITCLTIGTRGDVQPFVALCKGLMAEGHTCRIATHAEYKQFVESHGIEFRPVGGSPAELMVRQSSNLQAGWTALLLLLDCEF